MGKQYKLLKRIEGQVSQSRPEMIPLHNVQIDARVTKMVQPDSFWVEVDKSEQMLYLYFNSEIQKAWRVSTGRPGGHNLKSMATRPGVYKVYRLYEKYPMWGRDWWCPDVPWVIWFHGELAIHAAYWHNDFGLPVSHGCVNMAEVDAKELYLFMKSGRYGTVIWVH